MHTILYNAYRECNTCHIYRTSLKKQNTLVVCVQTYYYSKETVDAYTRAKLDKSGDSKNSTYFGSTEQISGNEDIGRYTGSTQKPVVFLGRT